MKMALVEVDGDGATQIRPRPDMVYQTGSSDRCISVELIGG